MEIIDLIPFESSLSYTVLGHKLLFSNQRERRKGVASKITLCREDHTCIADNTIVITAYITGRHVVCQMC